MNRSSYPTSKINTKNNIICEPNNVFIPKKTVVLYHFFEHCDLYRANLTYFIENGVNPGVDYLIVISGGCSFALPFVENVRYMHVPNRGLDFGAYANALSVIEFAHYNYFIFMNCTTRGPFLLEWHDGDWTRRFTDLMDDYIRLVGLTVNFLPGGNDIADAYATFSGRKPPFPHVQSMAFAVDHACLAHLMSQRLFDAIPDMKTDIVAQVEIHMSQLVLAHGWNIACLAPDYRGVDFQTLKADINPTSYNGDPWFPGAYFSRSLHPYETVFFKNNRGVRPYEEIESLSRSQAALKLRRRTWTSIGEPFPVVSTAWSGHRLFMGWLVQRINAGVVVDLSIGHVFASLCSATAYRAVVDAVLPYEATHSQEDWHASRRGIEALRARRREPVRIVEGRHVDVVTGWAEPVDILYIDGLDDTGSLDEDHLAWKDFVRDTGIVMFHGTCKPTLGVRRYFDEISVAKLNFQHSSGLGVASRDTGLIVEIAEIFSSLVEPGSLKL